MIEEDFFFHRITVQRLIKPLRTRGQQQYIRTSWWFSNCQFVVTFHLHITNWWKAFLVFSEIRSGRVRIEEDRTFVVKDSHFNESAICETGVLGLSYVAFFIKAATVHHASERERGIFIFSNGSAVGSRHYQTPSPSAVVQGQRQHWLYGWAFIM